MPAPYNRRSNAYVEVDVQVSSTAKFSIADLKCDSHLIALVQFFVETFFRMRPQLDIVCCGRPYPPSSRQGCEGAKSHDEDSPIEEDEGKRKG